ncbi:type II toxin-antitoxin system HicA family toxin [Candidatus Saccharibacteria bacterium]|nr:MAG: type II toxin-antitoxin system HicA family toxin [Candidatus Saccharibacteria bacterium]
MPKLPSSKEIIRTLEKHGFEFVSQRGSHAKYRSGERTVIIPTPRKEIPLGTFRSIVRQSGLYARDFKK